LPYGSPVMSPGKTGSRNRRLTLGLKW